MHTNIARYIAVETREDQVAFAELGRLAGPDEHALYRLWDERGLLPFDCLLIRLARRARRGAESDKLEVGMRMKQHDESLADRSLPRAQHRVKS